MSREMKDSGVEWLGKIPQDWEVDRIKRAISSIKGGIWGDEAIGDVNDINCVRIADFERNYFRVGDVDFTKRNIPKSKQKEYLLENGDLLIEKSGGGVKTPVGFVALYDKDESAVYSNFTSKLSVNQNEANSNYIRYIFAALYEQGISFRSIKQTTGIQNIDLKSYLDEKIGYPKIELQRKIADCVSLKITEINSIIEKTKSTVADYKLLKQSIITETVTKGLDKNVDMIDSGIEWIGEIPNNWIVAPHKYVMYKYKNIKHKYEGEDILSLTTNGVIKRDLINPSGKMPATFDGYQKIYRNNLLLCLFDIDVTPRCVGLIPFDGLTSPAYSQFIVRKNGYVPYYNYLLRAIDDTKSFLHLSKNLRSSLTETDFGNINTIIPPIQEQIMIVDYLGNILPKIDELISKKQELLLQLKTYKKSMIYEYVTGKKEIN